MNLICEALDKEYRNCQCGGYKSPEMKELERLNNDSVLYHFSLYDHKIYDEKTTFEILNINILNKNTEILVLDHRQIDRSFDWDKYDGTREYLIFFCFLNKYYFHFYMKEYNKNIMIKEVNDLVLNKFIKLQEKINNFKETINNF